MTPLMPANDDDEEPAATDGSTEEPNDSATAGTGGADGSTGGMGTDDDPIPVNCGNGVVDPGEQCDDGNASNLDGCLVTCQHPSCRDGLLSGDETDIDCGAACPQACGGCQGCSTTNDCDAGLSCVDAICVASGFLSVSFSTDCHGDNVFGDQSLEDLPAGRYRVTALPSGGTIYPPPWDPPDSGWIWDVWCNTYNPETMRTPPGALYSNANVAYGNLMADSEEFDHPGGDFTCWIDDGICENNSGEVSFEVELACD